MNSNFDYEGAKRAGYSEEEIQDFLESQPKYEPTNQKTSFFENIMSNLRNFRQNISQPFGVTESGDQEITISPKILKKFPNFDYEGALNAGYSPDEIEEFLQESIPKKSIGEKAGRIATQYGLGAAESALLPYEISVAPLASPEAQLSRYREDVADDIERLLEQKSTGVWDQQDQQLLDSLMGQMQDPEKAQQFVQTEDIGIRGLAEKATGLDLKPEGILEKAAGWSGFIKDPKKIFELAKTGLKTKDVIKAIAPTGRETLRGIGAGIALEMAENGNFGPIGTMAAAVIGDVIGMGAAGVVKGAAKLAIQPKKTIAEAVAKFTPKEKIDLQKEIIKDFRDANIQADLGTLTDSNLIKWTQSRIAQSGLTGKALDEFKDNLTNQIKEEYKSLADSLGEAKFATNHEIGIVAKEGIQRIREADLAATRQFYENANKSLRENAFVDSNRLAAAIEKLEKSLKPGQIKSAEQQSVLNTLEKLKRDIYDSSGKLMFADVKDLMNNKIAINDIINYEVQGGAKQLLKGIVSELDRAIISHGKENPTFAKNYILANKRFSEHAKTFRNRDISRLLQESDPEKLLSRMNTISGIRSLENILKKSPEGKEIFNNLKRAKLDKVIEDNLIDSTSKQAKLGTFSKLLEKGKNRDVIREILGSQTFKRLEKLQKNAGRLADATQKFYNASKSGAVAADAAVIAKGMTDVAHILSGNPWPLAKTIGGVLATRKLSSLLADPEFLKLTEEAILSSEKGSQSDLVDSFMRLRPYILPALQESNES